MVSHARPWIGCGLFILCALPAVNAAAPSSASSVSDLDFDDRDKLAKHYVVFPSDRPECPTHRLDTGETAAGHGFAARAVDGDLLARVFPHRGTGSSYLGRKHRGSDLEIPAGLEDDRCLAACLERGTDIAVAGHTMPLFHYAAAVDDGSAQERRSDFDEWLKETCRKMEVCFVNYATKTPLEVFWLADDGRRVKQFDLEYGERQTRCFRSFVGHTFEALDEATDFYQQTTIEHITTMAFGTSPPSSSQRFEGLHEVERTVKNALDEEWKKHNVVQRTFSSLGFSKGKLPLDVFASMGAFYYNN